MALLRDLHRPVNTYGVNPLDFVQEERIVDGGRASVREVKDAIFHRYWIDLKALANTPHSFRLEVAERRAIIVDLTSVAFLSSYGVRVLLVAAKISNGKGGRLVLLCPDGHVAKVLPIARIDALVPMFDSEDAAVSALAE